MRVVDSEHCLVSVRYAARLQDASGHTVGTSAGAAGGKAPSTTRAMEAMYEEIPNNLFSRPPAKPE